MMWIISTLRQIQNYSFWPLYTLAPTYLNSHWTVLIICSSLTDLNDLNFTRSTSMIFQTSHACNELQLFHKISSENNNLTRVLTPLNSYSIYCWHHSLNNESPVWSQLLYIFVLTVLIYLSCFLKLVCKLTNQLLDIYFIPTLLAQKLDLVITFSIFLFWLSLDRSLQSRALWYKVIFSH